jgi:DivIVA domain-containing protein
MLTARELLNTRFDQVFRGYSASQVDAFIARLVGEYETLMQENKALKKDKPVAEVALTATRETETELDAVNEQLAQAQTNLVEMEQKIKAAQLELKLLVDEKAQVQQELRTLLEELSGLVARYEKPDDVTESLSAVTNGN